MIRTLLPLVLALCTGTTSAAPIALFDGKTFAGWEGDIGKTWRIENGAIAAGSPDKKTPRNEFLSTKKRFENFDLRLKFKITGDQHVNAGVQFRTERIPDHHEVIGFQADIGPGYYGALYDESRRRKILAKPDKATTAKALAAVGVDGWHTYRIRARGNHIQLWLNGIKTVDYTEKDPKIPTDGIIAIQIHGKMQAVIAYKDITIEKLTAAKAPAAKSRPNIVFILSDDMGWNQPGFNGGNKKLTPNLDKLATESLKLTQHYTHSVCAPTRGAFLTGRYAFRNWMDWRSEDFGKPSYLKALGLTLAHNDRGEPTRRIHALPTEERTIAEALKDTGYFTAITGKWHAGEWLPEHLPMAQGFQHQYGHYAWGISYHTKSIVHNAPARFAVYDWHRNQKPHQEDGYVTDLIAAEAANVIAAQKKDRPFFLYVPFNAVHGPLDLPPGFDGDKNDPLAIRAAMLKSLDKGVGTILDAIDRNGFRDNTLVVFTNDNGPVLEEMSTPWRGTKNTTFEGGVRVPCLLRWPGHTTPGTTNDGMMFIADWFSTFITLAGGKHKQDLPVDALDMTNMLFAGKPTPRQEIIFEVNGSVRLPTIRRGPYKLMGDMLFNIEKDPGEQTDIAAKHPKIVKDLTSRLAIAGAERPPLGNKPLLMDPPLPYVYGQQENKDIPAWLRKHVDAIRATQPKEWAPGTTPWPQAPKGAHAARQ